MAVSSVQGKEIEYECKENLKVSLESTVHRSAVTSEISQEKLELFEKVAKAITSYSSDSGPDDNERPNKKHYFDELFLELKDGSSLYLQLDNWKSALKIEATADSLLLRHLNPIDEASYKSDKGCFEGSRLDTLQTIETRSAAQEGPKLLWLHGPADFGKTAMAHTVAKTFDDQNRLAGCFFADKRDRDRQNPGKMVTTIAYQLAKWHADYRSKVVSILRGQDERRLHTGLGSQFDFLIKRPLAALHDRSTPLDKPLIVVLDGVDKIQDPKDSRQPLSFFIIQLAAVVPWLKVFVSSRKSPKLRAFERDDVQQLDISDPSQDLHYDVATVARLWGKDGSSFSDTSEQFEQDVEGLFRRVSTSMEILDTVHPDALASERIITRQQMTKKFIIVIARDIAYRQARSESVQSIVKDVLAEISCLALHMPLSEEGLLNFLQPLHPDVAAEELQDIMSLHTFIEKDGSAGPDIQSASPMNSILGLLTDIGCFRPLRTDMSMVHDKLAERCLRLLLSQLRFNPCSLESSYLQNKEVPDLASRVTGSISDALQYCSLYWMDHILQSGIIQGLRGPLADLLCSPQVLYWIEVLSLIGALERGTDILGKCAEHFKDDDQIVHASIEWRQLLSNFSGSIETSTSHAYVSALSWLTTSSFVGDVCLGALRMHPVFACKEAGDLGSSIGCAANNSSTILHRNGLTDILENSCCISLSRDGSRIVSGHADGSAWIWDARTGELMCGPLEGHAGEIVDIKFFPDDRRIVTGSDDETLRIWDTQSGAPIAEPLKDYTGRSWAIACSPDGRRIASSSRDKTVCIWDTQTGARIGRTLEAHQQSVFSIAYSPDGSRIVTGSWDKTLVIWNAQNCAPVGEPLRGHEGWVGCTAYSPDGSKIVSGSGDETVRIWDPQTGRAVGEPMKGHTGSVRSVAYSSDGSRIISGSRDDTVRIWNAHSRTPIGVIPRDESRWDSDVRCFLSIPSWWPRDSYSCPPTARALIHSDAPLYIPDDGWLRTLDGRLFIWVPPGYRERVCCRGPMGKIGPELRFDWKDVLNGKDWTKIMIVDKGQRIIEGKRDH